MKLISEADRTVAPVLAEHDYIDVLSKTLRDAYLVLGFANAYRGAP